MNFISVQSEAAIKQTYICNSETDFQAIDFKTDSIF